MRSGLEVRLGNGSVELMDLRSTATSLLNLESPMCVC